MKEGNLKISQEEIKTEEKHLQKLKEEMEFDMRCKNLCLTRQ
jgi:hypothetical protein